MWNELKKQTMMTTPMIMMISYVYSHGDAEDFHLMEPLLGQTRTETNQRKTFRLIQNLATLALKALLLAVVVVEVFFLWLDDFDAREN